MARAKKVKKSFKVPETRTRATDLNDAISVLEYEISNIMLLEIKPRREKIVEHRRDLMHLSAGCTCENLKKLKGSSSRFKCQNPDCGKVHRLRL